MEVEVESRGEIQAKGVACDEKVRHGIMALVLAAQVAEMEQGSAQGGPAMHRVLTGPELFGEFLTRMDATFYRQPF